MKKLFLYIFIVLMVCSNSFAIVKKHSGEGELFLNEEIIEEYLNYLNTRTQDHPLNFFISEDKKHVFVVILKDSNYKAYSGSGPVSRNKKECERKLKQKCYLFSNTRFIVWNNGINPIIKEESFIKRKITRENLISKLEKLGFIGESKNETKKIVSQKKSNEEKKNDQKEDKIKELENELAQALTEIGKLKKNLEKSENKETKKEEEKKKIEEEKKQAALKAEEEISFIIKKSIKLTSEDYLYPACGKLSMTYTFLNDAEYKSTIYCPDTSRKEEVVGTWKLLENNFTSTKFLKLEVTYTYNTIEHSDVIKLYFKDTMEIEDINKAEVFWDGSGIAFIFTVGEENTSQVETSQVQDCSKVDASSSCNKNTDLTETVEFLVNGDLADKNDSDYEHWNINSCVLTRSPPNMFSHMGDTVDDFNKVIMESMKFYKEDNFTTAKADCSGECTRSPLGSRSKFIYRSKVAPERLNKAFSYFFSNFCEGFKSKF